MKKNISIVLIILTVSICLFVFNGCTNDGVTTKDGFKYVDKIQFVSDGETYNIKSNVTYSYDHVKYVEKSEYLNSDIKDRVEYYYKKIDKGGIPQGADFGKSYNYDKSYYDKLLYYYRAERPDNGIYTYGERQEYCGIVRLTIVYKYVLVKIKGDIITIRYGKNETTYKVSRYSITDLT